MTGSWKKLCVLPATVAIALVLANSALAGSGSSVAGWETTLGTPTTSGAAGALYPGATDDTERVPFAIADSGQRTQRLHSITASLRVAPDGDIETASGIDIRGCLADWFTIGFDHSDGAVPAELASGALYMGQVELTMRDSPTGQDACQGAAPAVTLTVS